MICLNIDEMDRICRGLRSGTVTWGEICSQRHPEFIEQQTTKEQQ